MGKIVDRGNSEPAESAVGFSPELTQVVKAIGDLSSKIIDKPAVDGKIHSIPFKITKDEICSAYRLIDTKIEKEKPKEKSFRLRMNLSNGVTRKFNSFEQFDKDVETRPLQATAIVLRWEMTKYYDKVEGNPFLEKLGEKQFVELLITIPPAPKRIGANPVYIFEDEVIDGFGVISVRVANSDKMWNAELFKHVDDFVEPLKISATGFSGWLYKKRENCGRVLQKLVEIAPLVPLGFLFWQVLAGKTDSRLDVAFRMFAISFALYLTTRLFAFWLGKQLFNVLSTLRPGSVILINEYSKKIFEENQHKAKPLGLATLIVLVPFAVNVLSAVFCHFIGI